MVHALPEGLVVWIKLLLLVLPNHQTFLCLTSGKREFAVIHVHYTPGQGRVSVLQAQLYVSEEAF